MALRSIAISDFRCIEYTEFELDPKLTLIVGPNASGKTSLLEALYFLGRGRSFRTRRMGNLIRQGQHEFQIVGRVDEGGSNLVLGVRGGPEGTEARIGGRPALHSAELATHFAPHIIDPEVHRLLEEGPARRRRFVDWGVFHVEQSFLGVWQRYHRALKQRNAALRQDQPDALVASWDAELISSGAILNAMRETYVARLRGPVQEIGAALGVEIDLRLESGWDSQHSLEEAVGRSRSRDRRYRATLCGPHRADVAVYAGATRAKDWVSRGQQKLLAAAMTLAQLRLQELDRPRHGALLLDDPAAELDGNSLARLFDVISNTKSQLIVTALHPDVGFHSPARLFHVEQGRVTLGHP